MNMIHHHLSISDVINFTGKIVEFELQDGSHVEGRVIAYDEQHVYLTRTVHHKVAFSDIKRVSKYPPIGGM